MEDRNAVLAAMYQDDNEPVGRPLTPQSSRSRRIRVGAVEYEVPTVEYLQRLEDVISQQTRTIRKQQQIIDQMLTKLTHASHSRRLQTHDIEGLRRDMSRKVSQREFT